MFPFIQSMTIFDTLNIPVFLVNPVLQRNFIKTIQTNTIFRNI